MSTDVNGVSGILGQQGRAVSAGQDASSPSAAPDARSARTAPDDTVELPTLSRARELADSVRDAPVVDGKRVQAARNAIASGNYQVDPVRVAEKFMAFERQVYPT